MDISEIIQKLNLIRWRSPTDITADAISLIREHIDRIRRVIEYLENEEELSISDAYAKAQSAGHDAPEYARFMEAIFRDVSFRSAGVREPLILTIASYYFWSADRELGHLKNPWTPLMQLYEMGYTSSFDEDESGESLSLLIGYNGATERYDIFPDIE